MKLRCSCRSCKELVYDKGLCKIHFAEYGTLPFRTMAKWMLYNKIYYYYDGEIFISRGRLIEKCCSSCGEFFIGYARRGWKCFLCESGENVFVRKATEISVAKLIRKDKSINAMYTVISHAGPPEVQYWVCKNKECKKTFKVTLLEHKKFYSILCEDCR